MKPRIAVCLCCTMTLFILMPIMTLTYVGFTTVSGCSIDVRYAAGDNFTDYDSCSDQYIPQNGIEGHLYLPTPVDACSYISLPPGPGGFPTNSTWIALVYGYSACPTEMVVNIRNAGYTFIIASSQNDSHRTVIREISDTLFPIVVVEEYYANYLKENALSFSIDNPILVSVHASFIMADLATHLVALTLALGAATFFLIIGFPCLILCFVIEVPECYCGRCCCNLGIERYLQKIKKLRRNFEKDTCMINTDEHQPLRSRSLRRPFECYNSTFKDTVLKGFADLKSHRIDQDAVLQQLSKFSNAVPVCSQRFRISLLHYACLNGWNDIVKELVEKYSCDPNLKIYQPGIIWDMLAFSVKSCASLTLNFKKNDEILQVRAGKEELIYSFEVGDGAAIHCACKAGHLEIVKFLIEKGCDPECRNVAGATPLHFACWEGHLDIVRFLVEKGCNPVCTAAGLTPLHLACSEGHWDIIKLLVKKKTYSACINAAHKHKLTPLHYACKQGHLDIVKLLVELGIDPKSTDYDGYTPLHIACKYGHLNIVKYLVVEQHCDPAAKKSSVTPLDLANSHYYLSVSSFLTSPKISRQARYEYLSRLSFPPAFKVFVMGDHSAGKSTLVKAIQNRLTNTRWYSLFIDRFKIVTGVELNTAGIIPVTIDSKSLGSIIMYDLAGQREYYSSHAALLEKLVAYPGSLLMVVVDLSKNRNEIIQQLLYWSSFIESHCSQSDSKPNVVIVGSHADVVKSQQENPKEKSTDILKTVSINLQIPHEIIPLNCTQLASGGLNEVCAVIGNFCSQFQQEISTDIRLNFLHAFLCQDFEGVTACRVSEIVSKISMEKEWDAETVSQYLTIINDKSQFLYLRNDQDVNDSWVILDQGVLLSEVNGTIFAPENFKEYNGISSSTGVVPFSRIVESFPKHNAEMIISFMSHLEFCHQIAESEADLIYRGQLVNKQPFEKLYFFPALVNADQPEESCISIVNEQTNYKCGWNLRCTQPNQFLSLQFLHVLLLRLAFSFALAPKTAEEDKACLVLRRRSCDVWKAGIHWVNQDGIEAIVEVVELNTAVTVMMECLKGTEMACVRLRSEVIHTILEVKERFCRAVELKESLIHPAELSSYPLKNSSLLSSFTITELATAITDDKQVVTSEQGRHLKKLDIRELLYFEPYACFKSTFISQLFKDENSNNKVPAAHLFYNDAGKVALTLFKQACCSLQPTYQALRSALDTFSVFCGRNPLVPTGKVPFLPRRNTLGTADLNNSNKPILIMESHDQEDVTEDLNTISHMSDRPCLHELQYLRCQGGRRVKVIEGVAAHWENLAHALHFDSSVIEIVRRNRFHQTEDACRDILQRWLEGQEETRQPVNWATLIYSLWEAGFVDIAEDLKEAVPLAKPMSTRKPRRQEVAIELEDLSIIPDGTSTKQKPTCTRESHYWQETTEDFSIIPHRTDKPHLRELQCLQGRQGKRVKVIEGVAAEWEELAKALYFESSVIEHIKHTFHQTEDACQDMLQDWLEGRGETRQPVNWTTLIDGLIAAGFVDIATDLQEAVEDYPIDVVCISS